MSAEDGSRHTNGPEVNRRLIEPSKIDIYANLSSSHKSSVNIEPTHSAAYEAIFKQVSAARQFLWQYSDAFETRYTTFTTNANSISESVTEFVNTAREDPMVLARPGLITAAIAAGAVAPGTGRKPIKRLLFATAAGLAVATACYPNEAIEVSKRELSSVKSAAEKLWTNTRSNETAQAPEEETRTGNDGDKPMMVH